MNENIKKLNLKEVMKSPSKLEHDRRTCLTQKKHIFKRKRGAVKKGQEH